MSCFSNTSSHHDGGDEDRTMRTSSSSTPPKQNYEVFLSFRGEDTRYGFTDHLYNRLVDKGIEVFRDNEKLHVGEKIDQLFEAIKASKISIPIISPDYASSLWCLKELLQILECKETLGQLVLPIFYHVKPSDVRNRKRNFGKKFRQLCERSHEIEGKFVQKLENAFKEVAAIKGWESDKTADGYEGELVKIVVTRIFNELRKAVLVVPDFLVGVEEHVKEIKKMIDAKPNDAKIIGIYGMGGIGKTTLSKVLYNALCSDFERHSFVPNIREASKTKGMEVLQKQIISDILVDKSIRELSHVDEGITIIEKRFKEKKLLLLLDDVENKDQLNKLVAKNSWFGSESIIIITTRNKDVTMVSAVNLSYVLNELTTDQSYELFCKHAFGRDASCPSDLETITRDIVSTTGGLPLAVEVIGSLLCQKDEEFWKEALEKLSRVPHKKVRDKLKISYDYLEDEQQQIFLDIVCFQFRNELICGNPFEYAIHMWKSCGFHPQGGIEKLKSLSLIKKDGGYNIITIHDQLRDLGREIVRKEGHGNIGLCSRIWSEKEAIGVMERKQGTDKVQALNLKAFDGVELCYTNEDFEGMPNLRFLRMGDVHLTGDFEKLFLNLKWLHWGLETTYPSTSVIDMMEINFNPKKLVVLELFRSNITEDWKGWSYAKDLKVIKLYWCMNLTTTPDFSALEGLEELPIELWKMEELRELYISQTSIREIHIFKGYMTKLQRLSLAGSALVTRIPESIGTLRSLIMLDLSRTGVEELPDSIGELCNLESLLMEETPIKCLPTSIGMLSKLRELNLEKCTKLKRLTNLPSSLTYVRLYGDSMETLLDLGYLSQLENLYISGRYNSYFKHIQLDTAPENFSLQLELPVSLRLLMVCGCQTLHTLPDFSKFKYLSELHLKACPELMEINGLGGAESLKYLEFEKCRMLSSLGDLSHLKMLRKIYLFDCEKLSDVQGIEKLTSLTSLSFSGCLPKIKFPDLSMLTNLQYLRIHDEELLEIPSIQLLDSLESLYISRCKSLQYLPDLSQLTKLSSLDLRECGKLTEIQGIEKLTSLTFLSFSGCLQKIKFPDLSVLTNLKHLYIHDEELLEIPSIQLLDSLEFLDISRCKSLQHLPDLSQLTKLRRLVLTDCEKLTEIQGIEKLTSLTSLSFSGCLQKIKFPDLSMLTNLQDLGIHDKELMEIPGIQLLKSLEFLDISRCKSLQHLPDLSQLTKLRQLDLTDCEKLTEIQGIEKLTYLTSLSVSGCLQKIKFPDLSMLTNLQNLHIHDKELMEIPGIQLLKSLEFLDISRCKSLQHLPDLSQLTKLRRLDLTDCEKLTEIQGLDNLMFLKYLDIGGCFAPLNLPILPNVKIKSGPLEEERLYGHF